jgi:hypothetical protein
MCHSMSSPTDEPLDYPDPDYEPAELENPVAEEPDMQEQAFADWYIPGGDLTDEEREYLSHLAEPDDGPQWRFATEYGFMELIPPGPVPEPRELDPDEQREAAQRYIENRYGKTMQGGNYTSMVHRKTDGPDPLVQEPGP